MSLFGTGNLFQAQGVFTGSALPTFGATTVYLTSDQARAPSLSTPIEWDAALIDTVGGWSSANPTRLTFSGDYAYARAWGVYSDNYGSGGDFDRYVLRIRKDVTTMIPAYEHEQTDQLIESLRAHTFVSPVFAVSAGTYIEMTMSSQDATSRTMLSDYCAFGMQVFS